MVFIVKACIYSYYFLFSFFFSLFISIKISLKKILKVLEELDCSKQNFYIFSFFDDPMIKMNHGTLRNHWEKLIGESEIAHVRIHDIRHLIGGILTDEGVTLEHIAKVLGHTSTSVTKKDTQRCLRRS